MLDLMTCTLTGKDLEAFIKVIGKEITGIALAGPVDSTEKDELHIRFKNNTFIRIADDGQSCCEARFMTTDDNLGDYVGGNLLNIEVKPIPIPLKDNEDDDYHDIEFLEITTTKGSFVITNHNEHNGYYGGFDVTVTFGAVA
jgi:hypothetical protein